MGLGPERDVRNANRDVLNYRPAQRSGYSLSAETKWEDATATQCGFTRPSGCIGSAPKAALAVILLQGMRWVKKPSTE